MFHHELNKRQRLDFDSDMELMPYPCRTGSYRWVPVPGPDDPLPNGLVCAGKMETGQFAYVGKAVVGDQMAAGFFLKETREIHLPYGCREHQLQAFDILVVDDQDSIVWEQCSDGEPPMDTACVPLEADAEEFDEIMLIGRTSTPLTDGVTYDGHLLELSPHALTGPGICRAGKIHQNHGCLYVPFSGLEYIFYNHEMLMLKTTPESLQRICRWAILTHLGQRHSSLRDAIESLPIPRKLKDFLEDAE